MASLAQKQFRAQEIVNFFLAHSSDKKVTIDHFKEQNYNIKTIRRAIERYQATGTSNFKPITGRPVTQATKNAKRVILREYKDNPIISVRSLATKAKVSKSTCANIKKDLGGKTYKQKLAPKMINNQEERIIRGARQIYKSLVPSGGSKILIEDDESYIPLDPMQVPGNNYYTEFEGQPVAAKYKFKPKEKFSKKFFIWIAHDSEGNFSDPYIQSGTMGSDCYLKNCLKGAWYHLLRSTIDLSKSNSGLTWRLFIMPIK